MANFIRAANPIWFFVDLIGLPLNDNYYISFLENTFPYIPQPIFRDNQGLVAWTDPIHFESNGTLQDNLYFNDTLVYRLEIRRQVGLTPAQSDPLIYEVNDYVPGSNGSGSEETGTEDNQISNPQFSIINFTSPKTITTAGTYSVAPGWDLVLTGSGSATLTQIIFTGAQNLEDMPAPPYALRIETSGWTEAILYQRFRGNGAIWSNEFVSMSVLARTSNSVPNRLSLVYRPNSPGTPQPIESQVLSSGFQIIQGVIALPVSTNSTLNNLAYVDMQIVLPPTAGSVDISNVQVMGQVELIPSDFAQTPEETIERQVDHLFHYYRDSIIIQPKNTILAGWNFGLNPYQFTFSGAPNIPSTTPLYVTDQTIIKMQAAGSLAVSRNTTPYGTIIISARSAVTQGQFAIFQYIDPSTMYGYWGTRVSSLVRAYVGALGSSSVKIKMRLIYRTSLPSTLGAAEPIVSYDANGDPVFAAGWTAIIPENDPAYTLTTPDTSLAGIVGIPSSFNNFILPTNTTATQTLGIVLYTVGVLDESITQQMFINEISLVPNSFAIDSSPETFDESLRKCEFYYEKSYDNASLPGATTSLGRIQVYADLQHNGTAFELYPAPIPFTYRTVKRGVPIITLFSPFTGASGQVGGVIYLGSPIVNAGTSVVIGNWDQTYNSTKSVVYSPANTNTFLTSTALAATQRVSGAICLQYTLDSRLGN